jgi:hypothetical protein
MVSKVTPIRRNQILVGPWIDFRKYRSTVTALLGISDDIYPMLEQKLVVALLLLNLTPSIMGYFTLNL